MKSAEIVLTALSVAVASFSNAFASVSADDVDTSLTHNSDILMLAFAGFLALIVVVQTIPAIVSLYTLITKAAKKNRQHQTARADAHD